MLKKAKRPGRPKLPKSHGKGTVIPVRANGKDRRLFEKAAKADGHKTLSGWISHTLRKATQICPS